MDKEKNSYATWLVEVAAKVICPLLLLMICVLSSTQLFLGRAVGDINSVDGLLDSLLCFSLPMFVSIALVPALYEKFVKKKTFEQIGLKLKKTKSNIVFFVINVVILCIAITTLYIIDIEYELTILISFVFVAFSEELMMRGILLETLREKLNWILSAIICSFLFAFVYHSGEDPIINLCWRFPVGFILCVIAKKTGSIYQGALVHLWLNILVNTIWFI